MRKIAFISDIHSNIEALKAVVAEIMAGGCDEIYCLGDIVGYNCFPNEVCDFLRSADIPTILGNHDADVLAKKFNSAKSPDIFEWTYNELTEENRHWLASLPLQRELLVEAQKVVLVHGSPNSIEEYCFEGSEISSKVMKAFDGDMLVCGHTHMPMKTYYGAKALMNPGSVGKPKNGSPKATWLEISFFNALVNPRIKEVAYDVEKTAKRSEELGFTKYAAQLYTGEVS